MKSLLDFSDLMNVTLRGDDVQGFFKQNEKIVLSMKETPGKHLLASTSCCGGLDIF